MHVYQLLKLSPAFEIDKYVSKIDRFEYEFLTTYINGNKDNGEMLHLFPETKTKKEVCFYFYEIKTESYKGIDGQDVHYTRTARVN